jgi:arginine:pyruvate transaminase
MRLAARIAHMTGGAGDGWEVYYRARALRAAGFAVSDLTIGEHDIRTDPAILEAMHASARAGATGYTVGAGIEPLRRAVAERAERMMGVPTRPEEVVITPGGQAALFAAHMALLDPGDVGLYLSPHYATYPGTIRATGAEAVAVPTRPEAGFEPEPEALAAALAAHPGARTLLVNSPNNPTGAVLGPGALAVLAQAAADSGLWLISDEVYDSLVWEGRHLSPRALPGMAGRTVVVGSMSKSHAMTGSRLGWLIGPPEVTAAVTALATNTTYGVPGFIQEAALWALGQGPEFEARIAEPFRRRRALALEVLAGARGVRPVPPRGAMFVMLDIRATGLSGEAFAARLLEAERIAVMPGESFGAAAAGHVRVALTLPDDRLADALSRIACFAAALTG